MYCNHIFLPTFVNFGEEKKANYDLPKYPPPLCPLVLIVLTTQLTWVGRLIWWQRRGRCSSAPLALGWTWDWNYLSAIFIFFVWEIFKKFTWRLFSARNSSIFITKKSSSWNGCRDKGLSQSFGPASTNYFKVFVLFVNYHTGNKMESVRKVYLLT